MSWAASHDLSVAGADDRKLPSVFYADTRINSAIQQIYHEIDDNNEGGDQYKDALNHGVIAVGDRSDQKIAHARNRKNLFQNNAVCHNICDCHAPEGQYRNQGVFQHMVIHNTACTVSAGIGGAHIVGIELREHRVKYVEDLCEEGTEIMLDLMCAVGREPFYHKHEFISRPTDKLGPGMIRYIRK